MSEMKKYWIQINSWLDTVEEKSSATEGIVIETIQNERHGRKDKKKGKNSIKYNFKESNICIFWRRVKRG